MATHENHQSPDGRELIEMSPEFTDTARAALLWVLWHHQGGSSPIGQPIRFALGMGAREPLNDHQLAEAKRWDALSVSRQQATRTEEALDATRKALRDAATSLETISRLSGRDSEMLNMEQVRAYAFSRAQAARSSITETMVPIGSAP